MTGHRSTWEADRFDWSQLGAMGSAKSVPNALRTLVTATTPEAADAAYWRIDNVVVVQGALYESAVPTAACLVAALPGCLPVARVRVLELLGQLGAGEGRRSQGASVANADIAALCRQEILRGFGVYLYFLENCENDEERVICVDLIGICASADPTLRVRVRAYIERLLNTEQNADTRTFLRNWLDEVQ